MARPPRYDRDFAFTEWAEARPKEPLPGDEVDSELDDVALAVNATQDSLALIQREDGEVANDTIGFDQLTEEVEAMLGQAGAPGPAGPAIPGPIGLSGPQGPPLPWLVVSSIPSNAVGVIGQLALNASNGDVYQKTEGGWALVGNIRGPAGTGGTGGTGVTDHGALTGLADPDHPIAAIQGLQLALDDLATGVAAASNGITVIYRQPEAPNVLGMNEGDLWFDSDNGNRMYRWDIAGFWRDVADERINTAVLLAGSAISQVSGLEAQVDGKVTTFYASAPPTAEGEGDLWIDTDDNEMYRWNGAAWITVQDKAIAAALTTSQLAYATADGKVTTFYMPNPPVPIVFGGPDDVHDGDLWFDTNDNNRPYQWRAPGQWDAIPPVAGVVGGVVTEPGIAPALRPRAWVKFYGPRNPTGGGATDKTVYINRRYNFASIVWVGGGANSGGYYQCTFQTPLPNKDYCVSGTAYRYNDTDNPLVLCPYSFATTGFRLKLKRLNTDYDVVGLCGLMCFCSDDIDTAPPAGQNPGTDPSPPGGFIP